MNRALPHSTPRHTCPRPSHAHLSCIYSLRYVNCLMVQTEDVPVALCAAAGWAGPEGLFVVTRRPDFAAARERIAGGDGDGPHGGALSLWAITRNLIEVPSSRDTSTMAAAPSTHTHPSCAAL